MGPVHFIMAPVSCQDSSYNNDSIYYCFGQSHTLILLSPQPRIDNMIVRAPRDHTSENDDELYVCMDALNIWLQVPATSSLCVIKEITADRESL